MHTTQARQIFALTLVSWGSHWTGVFSQDSVRLTPNPTVTSAANISKSDDVPVDLGVLTGRIDNDLIYRSFLASGKALTLRTDILDAKQISELLKQQRHPAAIRIPNTGDLGNFDFETIARSSLLFGTVYDCGRCNQLHANVAGGVVVSHDGLALTNYHVLDRDEKGTLAVFAMTIDGRAHPVAEVLSANKELDVALVRLGGEGPFFPAAIATKLPLPMESATVLSHPKNQFLVLTQGAVSRHVTLNTPNGPEQWTEITADYAAGSSGSGVFNSRGELIGLVSRNFPILRDPPGTKIAANEEQDRSRDSNLSFVELVLRRCVTLDAIRGCFAQ